MAERDERNERAERRAELNRLAGEDPSAAWPFIRVGRVERRRLWDEFAPGEELPPLDGYAFDFAPRTPVDMEPSGFAPITVPEAKEAAA